jgi:hypothetical protein
MDRRRFITRAATIALIALTAGCATQKTGAVASSTASDASGSALPHELVGTWTGAFEPATGADGGGGGSMYGDMTIEIKDDGTYTLKSTRRGRGDAAGRVSSDSGAVVASGRSVTLKSSSGQWLTLMRDGDTLYGVVPDRSRSIMIRMTVEKTSSDFASPKAPNAQ